MKAKCLIIVCLDFMKMSPISPYPVMNITLLIHTTDLRDALHNHRFVQYLVEPFIICYTNQLQQQLITTANSSIDINSVYSKSIK